jgi:toxin ParE1/3/4
MAKYKITNKAVDDLTQIWNYTFDKWSENQADKYYQMLLDNCSLAAFNLEIGRNYSIVTDNLLGFKAGRHIIFYQRFAEHEIEIIRILHEQMDLKNRLKDK